MVSDEKKERKLNEHHKCTGVVCPYMGRKDVSRGRIDLKVKEKKTDQEERVNCKYMDMCRAVLHCGREAV